jgi:tetratricopeptide (TPR) repeat protein
MMMSEKVKTFFGKVKDKLKPEDIAKFVAKEAVGAIPIVGQIIKDAFDEFSPDEKGEVIKELKDLSESQFKEISGKVGVSVEYLKIIQKISLYSFKELRADHEEIKELLRNLIETVETPVNVIGGAGITAGDDVSMGDVTGQLAIGKYITQVRIEKPSGEALVKLIDFLDQKRQESVNKEILKSYTPSALPDYPPRLRAFVTENRVDELTQALRYLQDHRILLISGVGGVGKTTLARALVETRPANVPLPFWFDFSKNIYVTLGDVLEKLASYMNTSDIAKFKAEGKEAGQEDINRLTDELQNREPAWLVFDNLEIILEGRHFHDLGIASLFTALRDSTHPAKIIVTSRILPILGDGESLIDVIEEEKQELKGLRTNFAVDYLTKNGLENVAREKLEELAKGVDGHPLALKLLVGVVKAFGASDTLNDLSVYQKRKEDTIKKARRLFDKLAGDEKELLERISVYRQPELRDAIKKMFTDKTPVDAMEKLIDKSLREFSYDDLEDKREAHKVAVQYYLSLPVPEERSEKADILSLIEACYHASMAGDYDMAAKIIYENELHKDLYRWGDYTTLVELYEKLLPEHFGDEPKLRSRHNHGTILGNFGNAYSALGQVERAIKYYEQALAISKEIGDRRGEGTWLGNLGNAYSALGQVERAIRYYEQVLSIDREIGDRRGEGTWLGNLGVAYSALRQVERAIKYYEQALAISQEIGDRRNEGTWLGNLGNAYNVLGQVERAIEYHEQALAISQEIGDRRGEGADLGNLANAYYALGQVERAIGYYEQALAITQEIGDRRGEGADLGNLGLAYYALGQVERAIECYEQALAIAREIGDKRGEGYWLNNLGVVFEDLENHDLALACYLLARKIRREIGDPEIETTENDINELKTKIGTEEFQKLLDTVEPKAEEIIQGITK